MNHSLPLLKNHFCFLFILLAILMCKTTWGQQETESDFYASQKDLIPAKFPGGTEAWQKFLEKKLNTEVPIKNNAPVGRYDVVVSFVVEKDGTVSKIEPIKDPGYGTVEELIRVIKKSPKWIPASIDGKAVAYKQKQSISFFVSEH
ncbi:MAG TPA: hypothetical protein PLA68_08525 [Panacibacter sp.]|nr:hypothetical protein [Panacibacter sp.]